MDDKNCKINREIYQQGPALFEAVKGLILEKATVPQSGNEAQGTHVENKAILQNRIHQVCGLGQWNGDISREEFWDKAWGRVVYSGTSANKASTEIESMRSFSFFRNIEEFDEQLFRFNKDEWERFASHWKRRFFWCKLRQRCIAALPAAKAFDINQIADFAWARGIYGAAPASSKGRVQIESRRAHPEKTDPDRILWNVRPEDWPAIFHHWQNSEAEKFDDWISFAKAQPDYCLDGFSDTGNGALALMTKSGEFENIKFSAHPEKMRKYVELATFIKNHGADPILEHYTGPDYCFQSEHLTGADYEREKHEFWRSHAAFSEHFGYITSLHLMMDLGFKTVKPDRVLTYLFSSLGWLVTLPASMSKTEVLKNYMHPSVTEEMLHRADVLAASLSEKYANPHRLLDIWFVKYGQEPESSFGITVNLEKAGFTLEKLLESVRDEITCGSDAGEMAKGEFGNRWPSRTFSQRGRGRSTR